MLKINGANVYNLTGIPIRMIGKNGKPIIIGVDGFAPANRGGEWRKAIIDSTTSIDYHYEHRGYDYYNVDPIDEFVDQSDGNWAAIVTTEYLIGCLDMGLPTDRLYTVGKPIVNEDGIIEGYEYLIKR